MTDRQRFLAIDTLATAAQLNTLTQGNTEASALHRHADGVWLPLGSLVNGWTVTTAIEYMEHNGLVRLRGSIDGRSSTDPIFLNTLVPTAPSFISANYSSMGITTGINFRLNIITFSPSVPFFRFVPVDGTTATPNSLNLENVEWSVGDVL